MAKKDMDLYHSRLTQDDLNELIIKYKIPRDIHSRLPSEYFVMSEFLDNAIGVHHHIFDFFGVRIPFSSLLLVNIKHYKVHFTQLGPLGLNKVITFEVLCQSLQIEPTVTLFRVIQTLCKQGDWFSFANHRAPSSVWIDDNPIDDLKPVAGFYRMADVRRLSAHMVKLRDMPERVLVLSGLSRVSKSQTCDPVLQVPMEMRLPFYCTHAAAFDAAVPDHTSKELAVSNTSAKVIAKAKASQKRKASTSGSASGHVAKHTESAIAQSFGSTTRPNLFADNSGAESDDDACYEILIVTPIRSADVIPPLGNQRKGNHDADAAAAPLVDFFPFSPGPYNATYPEGGIAGNCEFTREEWDAPHQPTMKIKALSSEQLTTKMSVLRCLMMSHGGYKEKYASLTRLESQVSALHRQITGLNDKLSASYASFAKSKAKGNERKKKMKSLTKSLDNLHAQVALLSANLNRATVLKAEKDEEIIPLKATPLAFASFFQGQFQALVWKFLAFDEFSRVQNELLSLAASAGLNVLEPEKLARSANVSTSRDACVSPPIAKELTVKVASTSLELLFNIVPTFFAVTLELNDEWVNAMVDGPNNEMVDVAANAKPGDVFVQGVSHVVDDVTELTVTWSKCASFGPSDVVVVLSAGEKGDGSVPSSTIKEGRGAWYAREHLLLRAWGKLTVDVLLSIQRILSHATRPKPNAFPLGPLV
uniref:Transposase (putative) gypsy type domain-containing protein n=1 Tax=Tanacetum cinerariifolium TaxID=118510 RepID=A0A6L2LG34_TANCI|nr:hypothetical protein [Tanacetum cinerariifolium]